jgi:diaminopimelate epimerase
MTAEYAGSSIRFDARPAPPAAGGQPGRVRFVKMEGTGNDYIYVEEFAAPLQDPAPLAVRMSDRHFGVGGDGLVLIGPADANAGYPADFRMRIFNADGSEAEMCGNASRCVGKYLYENGLTDKTVIRLQTGGGLRVLELDTERGKVRGVRVNMGAPVLKPADIPMNAPGERFVDGEIQVLGQTYRGTAVSMGNPHLVVPCPDLCALRLEAVGPAFERHALFPKRVNTEFVEVVNRSHIRMRVWERGSGETLACGTGACAALTACALNGWTERKAVVELRGGSLDVEWAGDNNVYMSGPASFVFSGEFFV